MDALISHHFFGPTRAARDLTAGLSLEEAMRLIGMNTLAGFEPVVYTRTPAGDQLRTRAGRLLTVVALHGSAVRGAIEIEQV
ncbi:hypothetical protein [Streptomyces sp. NPDC002547]